MKLTTVLLVVCRCSPPAYITQPVTAAHDPSNVGNLQRRVGSLWFKAHCKQRIDWLLPSQNQPLADYALQADGTASRWHLLRGSCFRLAARCLVAKQCLAAPPQPLTVRSVNRNAAHLSKLLPTSSAVLLDGQLGILDQSLKPAAANDEPTALLLAPDLGPRIRTLSWAE